jgi:hypothetical protein
VRGDEAAGGEDLGIQSRTRLLAFAGTVEGQNQLVLDALQAVDPDAAIHEREALLPLHHGAPEGARDVDVRAGLGSRQRADLAALGDGRIEDVEADMPGGLQIRLMAAPADLVEEHTRALDLAALDRYEAMLGVRAPEFVRAVPDLDLHAVAQALGPRVEDVNPVVLTRRENGPSHHTQQQTGKRPHDSHRIDPTAIASTARSKPTRNAP